MLYEVITYSEALPDFVKLAEAMHAVGIRCEKPGELDHAIKEMIEVDRRQRGALMEEGLQILKAAWGPEPFSFHVV